MVRKIGDFRFGTLFAETGATGSEVIWTEGRNK